MKLILFLVFFYMRYPINTPRRLSGITVLFTDSFPSKTHIISLYYCKTIRIKITNK